MPTPTLQPEPTPQRLTLRRPDDWHVHLRDGAILPKVGFPVFARGLCIRGTGKNFEARGWINSPIVIGDVTVHPGDLVVGDTDGVCVVPREKAATVLDNSVIRETKEADIMEKLRAGSTTIDLYGWDR